MVTGIAPGYPERGMKHSTQDGLFRPGAKRRDQGRAPDSQMRAVLQIDLIW